MLAGMPALESGRPHFFDHPRNAQLGLVLTAILWSTGGLFIKLVDAHPMLIAGLRSGIALLVMLAFNPRPRFNWSLPQIGTGVAYALTMISFVAANKLTTSANAIFLQYSAPVYVAVLAVLLLGERWRPRDGVAMAAIVAGTILFFAERLDSGNLWGNLVAIFSGLAFAFTFIFSRMQQGGNSSESFMLAHGICFLAGLPFLGGFNPGWSAVGGLLGLGILQVGLSSVLFTASVRHVPTLAGVLIVTLEPVLNPLWVFLASGELPSPLALAGGLVIIVTVAGLQLYDFWRPAHDPAGQSPASPTGGKAQKNATNG